MDSRNTSTYPTTPIKFRAKSKHRITIPQKKIEEHKHKHLRRNIHDLCVRRSQSSAKESLSEKIKALPIQANLYKYRRRPSWQSKMRSATPKIVQVKIMKDESVLR